MIHAILFFLCTSLLPAQTAGFVDVTSIYCHMKYPIMQRICNQSPIEIYKKLMPDKFPALYEKYQDQILAVTQSATLRRIKPDANLPLIDKQVLQEFKSIKSRFLKEFFAASSTSLEVKSYFNTIDKFHLLLSKTLKEIQLSSGVAYVDLIHRPILVPNLVFPPEYLPDCPPWNLEFNQPEAIYKKPWSKDLTDCVLKLLKDHLQ
jgi:hypothetical protein